MLGADHHGYVGRLMAMCAAFGDTPDVNLEILIGQMVNLLSRRRAAADVQAGRHGVTLDDLVEAIGVDAARYALARYSTDSTIDIDLDLWAKASNDNPVYYVQYAHARVSSLLRNAADLGLDPGGADTDAARRTRRRASCSARWRSSRGWSPRRPTLREPHRVARYLEDTAGAYHRFYDNCRVLPMGDEEPTDLHRARLLLVEATRTVLGNGLRLLGVSAPERM